MYTQKVLLNSDMLFFSGVGLILYWSWSWTENCLQLIDDLSKIWIWIINHFTWNDRWSIFRFWSWIVHPQSQTFKQKLWCCEEFSSQPFVEDKIFLLSTMKKKLLITKIFFINKCRFSRKIAKLSFSRKVTNFGGGSFSTLNLIKNGGVCTPFWKAAILRQVRDIRGDPPPKIAELPRKQAGKKDLAWNNHEGIPVADQLH